MNTLRKRTNIPKTQKQNKTKHKNKNKKQKQKAKQDKTKQKPRKKEWEREKRWFEEVIWWHARVVCTLRPLPDVGGEMQVAPAFAVAMGLLQPLQKFTQDQIALAVTDSNRFGEKEKKKNKKKERKKK
jgi:hypothetical protein